MLDHDELQRSPVLEKCFIFIGAMTRFIDDIIRFLRIRLDSYVHHQIHTEIVWLEVKLDVAAIYMMIVTLNFWIYQIYNQKQ